MAVNIRAMQDKKTKKGIAANPDRVPLSFGKAGNFIGDLKQEFQKISWTTAEELKSYTKIVVGATFSFGMLIYLSDLVVQGCLEVAGSLIRMVIG